MRLQYCLLLLVLCSVILLLVLVMWLLAVVLGVVGATWWCCGGCLVIVDDGGVVLLVVLWRLCWGSCCSQSSGRRHTHLRLNRRPLCVGGIRRHPHHPHTCTRAQISQTQMRGRMGLYLVFLNHSRDHSRPTRPVSIIAIYCILCVFVFREWASISLSRRRRGLRSLPCGHGKR